MAALWLVCYREMIHLLYPSGTPGFAFDLTPKGLLTRYAAYLLSFLNVLVPDIDPERAGWAIPPHLSALAATLPMRVAMACLVAAAAALMVAARWRPARVGQSARVAAFGLTWFLAATSPFAVLADRLFIRYTYFGHAGLAIAAGALASAVTQSILEPRTRKAEVEAPKGYVAAAGA
jgi:hypothetical protein